VGNQRDRGGRDWIENNRDAKLCIIPLQCPKMRR
jgi:hypothetical protein